MDGSTDTTSHAATPYRCRTEVILVATEGFAIAGLNARLPHAANSGMKQSLFNGFTLVELVVTLAIASILLGVGVPSFVELVKDGRLQADTAELNMALFYARSEAVKRSGSNGNADSVTVCARASDAQCADDEDAWNNGWLVFTDNTFASTDEHASVDAGDEVLRVVDQVSDGTDVLAIGSDDRTAGGASRRSYIRYDATGASNWENGYFAVCDERAADRWKGLNVALTGDVRPARRNADGDALLDAFGRDITACL